MCAQNLVRLVFFIKIEFSKSAIIIWFIFHGTCWSLKVRVDGLIGFFSFYGMQTGTRSFCKFFFGWGGRGWCAFQHVEQDDETNAKLKQSFLFWPGIYWLWSEENICGSLLLRSVNSDNSGSLTSVNVKDQKVIKSITFLSRSLFFEL